MIAFEAWLAERGWHLEIDTRPLPRYVRELLLWQVLDVLRQARMRKVEREGWPR